MIVRLPCIFAVATLFAAGLAYAFPHPYDAAGRLAKVTQPARQAGVPGLVTSYQYDDLGNKVAQVDALGHDAAGNIVPGNQRTTRWEYDALGRVSKRTLPGGHSESFTYDAVGNVATHTNFNGQAIGYAYDELNRVRTKTLPGGNTIAYTYTPTGLVDTVTDVRGVTRHFYDCPVQAPTERDRCVADAFFLKFPASPLTL